MQGGMASLKNHNTLKVHQTIQIYSSRRKRTLYLTATVRVSSQKWSKENGIRQGTRSIEKYNHHSNWEKASIASL